MTHNVINMDLELPSLSELRPRAIRLWVNDVSDAYVTFDRYFKTTDGKIAETIAIVLRNHMGLRGHEISFYNAYSEESLTIVYMEMRASIQIIKQSLSSYVCHFSLHDGSFRTFVEFYITLMYYLRTSALVEANTVEESGMNPIQLKQIPLSLTPLLLF